VVDSTDLYAFVSPDKPSTVTILANYVPLQDPAGGPNFFEFGDDVIYKIHIDNNGDGLADWTYTFKFHTETVDPNTFLYNTSTITAPAAGSSTYANFNRPQLYYVSLVDGAGHEKILGSGLPCPPCNIGPRSTPNYPSLSAAAHRTLPSGELVFAGQRAEGFFVDLGSIFDLGGLRPLNSHHLIPLAAASGINSLASKNVHTIAIQVPISNLTSSKAQPTSVTDPAAVLGIWTTASRQTVRRIAEKGVVVESGPYVQVSRLGNPLVNEVVVPVSLKDYFNSQEPVNDSQFAAAVVQPELATLIPILYPGAFPNLAAYQAAGNKRTDIEAIFVTGIPASVLPSAPTNVGGKAIAEMLRLNVAVPPTTVGSTGYSALGVIGGDIGGFPNGRRPQDDVVTIALRALAGATIPLVDKSYTVDAVVSAVGDGAPSEPSCYIAGFPYLADPHDGYDNPSTTSLATADSK
jgi:DNA-binding Lrp family transcriptional regulator